MKELQLQDIQDNLVIIKINQLYKEGMSAAELYDITRGSWKRKIESVKDAEYALAVSESKVIEVYKIKEWLQSEEVTRETIPYDPEKDVGRISFNGEVASDDIRARYIDSSVKSLFKWGEADPVKMIYKYDPSSDVGKKLYILDASQNIEFKSIYEAINACVGTSYTGWMRACYPASNGNFKFRMWFPKLAKIKEGEKVSAAFDCINTIADDWNQVVFEDLKRSPDYEEKPENIYKGYDLIFAKDIDGGYLFRGVFVYDEANSKGNRFVSKRIATKVRLIGNPAEDIELLDSVQLKGADKELIDKGVSEENNMNANTKSSVKSLNTILYGPPGTGKTYSTASYAVSICDGKPIDELGDRDAVMERFNELKAEKRIVFTTFHQSYGYEEFIEGIKPQLEDGNGGIGYELADGVFKEFCNEARALKVHANGTALIKEQPRIWGMILGGTGKTKLKTECFDNNEIRLGWDEVKDSDIEGDYYGDENASWNGKHMVFDFKNTMEIGDVVVVEKTNKSIDAIGVITGDYEYDESSNHYARSRKVEWLAKDIDQDMVAFLPKGRKQLARFSLFAFDYIGMDAISKILEKHLQKPLVEVEKEIKPYVFIIDEINRGNISKIFGELITLIEDTKREGNSDASSAILPYSGAEFSVPNNVYILGTMNTADRSIALLDTALRRRFSFIEMMPNAAVLEGINTISGEQLDVSRMLRTINKRIEFLYDREHKIGHAFFMGLKDNPTKEKLASIFENSVIPLLQEYFYEDYQKIQLVLGDNAKTEDKLKFVVNSEIHLDQTFKGNVEEIVDEKPMEYKINKDAFTNIEAYRQIM